MITISRILSSYIIGDWSKEEDQKSKILYYITLSMTFALSQAVLASLRCAIVNYYSVQGTKKLHEQMIKKVMAAPVNLYYDVTPIGRILNKFSKDLNDTETGMPGLSQAVICIFYELMYIVIVAVVALPWISLIIPIFLYIMWKMIQVSSKSLTETIRVQSTCKSPVLSFLGETISGASTIRAFGKQNDFIQKNNVFLN